MLPDPTTVHARAFRAGALTSVNLQLTTIYQLSDVTESLRNHTISVATGRWQRPYGFSRRSTHRGLVGGVFTQNNTLTLGEDALRVDTFFVAHGRFSTAVQAAE